MAASHFPVERWRCSCNTPLGGEGDVPRLQLPYVGGQGGAVGFTGVGERALMGCVARLERS